MALAKSVVEENPVVYSTGKQNGKVNEVNEESVSIEAVSPEKAERWLSGMGANRKVNEKHVRKLASDMARGKWKLSPQGIGFDASGALMDGQHRLHAIARSGVEVPLLVVRGLSRDIMPAIDENRKRSFSDDLQIAHEANTSTTAAAVLLIHRLEIGAGRNLKVASIGGLAFSRFELHDVKASLEQSGDVIASVREGLKLTGALNVPPSATSAAHFIGTRQYGEDFMEACYDRLHTGRDLGEDSPLLTLRERMIKLNLTRPKPMGFVYAAAILRVLRAQSKGESLSKLSITAIEAMRVRKLM